MAILIIKPGDRIIWATYKDDEFNDGVLKIYLDSGKDLTIFGCNYVETEYLINSRVVLAEYNDPGLRLAYIHPQHGLGTFDTPSFEFI